MEIKPSVYYTQVDRRQMQSWEMVFGGQGQAYLSAGLNTAPAGYVFYQIQFLDTSVLRTAGYYGSYNINTLAYSGAEFPYGFTWTAPLTSVSLSSGSGIGYLYKIPTDCCVSDQLALQF